MNKSALQAVFLFVCFIFSSCEMFTIRDVSSENLDTLKSDQLIIEDIPDQEQQLSSVRKYLGKRPSEVKLWTSEPLKSTLQHVLGNEYNAFVELMQNAAPLKEEKLIYSIGSHPNRSRIGFGYIIIDADKNLLRVGMVKPGKHRVFGAKASEMETPAEIEKKCKTIL